MLAVNNFAHQNQQIASTQEDAPVLFGFRNRENVFNPFIPVDQFDPIVLELMSDDNNNEIVDIVPSSPIMVRRFDPMAGYNTDDEEYYNFGSCPLIVSDELETVQLNHSTDEDAQSVMSDD